MKRMVCALSVLALVTSLVMITIEARSAPALSAKEIMGKLNKGQDCLNAKIGKELKADQPDWSAIQPETKDFATLAAALGTSEPPKGEKDSWAKLTKSYAENAKELDVAAQKKDKETAQAAHAALGKSCKACHTAHRGM